MCEKNAFFLSPPLLLLQSAFTINQRFKILHHYSFIIGWKNFIRKLMILLHKFMKSILFFLFFSLAQSFFYRWSVMVSKPSECNNSFAIEIMFWSEGRRRGNRYKKKTKGEEWNSEMAYLRKNVRTNHVQCSTKQLMMMDPTIRHLLSIITLYRCVITWSHLLTIMNVPSGK